MLALPLIGIWQLTILDIGSFGAMTLFGLDLVHVRVDKLSLVFGYIFYIAAFIGIIYALHKDDRLEETAALSYVGAAIGAIFAGDLVTLFVYWELTAITSVFIVWAGRSPRAYKAGQRYLIIQITSGVLLAAGAVVRANETGSITFDNIGLDSPGGFLILLAFGIKAAFPFLHNWLQDSYPEASETGTVFLSAFTTKLAIYALARGFAGTEELIWIGVTMTAFPIFYAVIENDLRRVLVYSLNNQVGFMVTGVGIGTELALNGAAAHAFAHILYKALLLMSVGAVLYRTGTAKGSELGGLFRTMPWTLGFCIVGSASISAFPLFSGFVTKTMILAAAAEQELVIPYLILLFASAGVFHHSGIKIPYFAFFAHDSGKRPKEAPANMLIAMGIAAALSIGIGVYPDPLYALLPFPVNYNPYTLSHVVTDLQLLMFSALAFAVLQRTGLYPPELRSTVLDTDWLYRKPAVWITRTVTKWLSEGLDRIYKDITGLVNKIIDTTFRSHGPDGIMARTNAVGPSVAVIVIMLTLFMLVFYIGV
jgi:multicomponent Na+:H+ antiporter subunit D